MKKGIGTLNAAQSSSSLHIATVVVIAVTFLAGAGALLAPRMLLGILAASTAGAGPYFVSIVGMLVVLFGGLLTHAMVRPAHRQVIFFWAGLEKFGFAVAMAAGYLTSLFGPVAVLIAAIDLGSGLILIGYRLALRAAATAKPS